MTEATSQAAQPTEPASAAKAETRRAAPPCAMVIFGAAGDLTKRLVMPALYNLVTAKRLPDGSGSSASTWRPRPRSEWRKGLTEMMNEFVAQAAASSRPTISTRPPGAG